MFNNNEVFNNNEGIGGFETGGYDTYAVQPTIINWTRKSRYCLPDRLQLLLNKGVENSLLGGFELEAYFTINSNRNILVTECNNDINYNNGRLIEIMQSGEIKELFIYTRRLKSPVISKEGFIYITTTAEESSIGHKLFCLYPDGRLKWEYNINDSAYSKPVLDSSGNVYIFAYGNIRGTLLSISPQGELNWKMQFPSVNWYDPIISKEGIIYLGLNVNRTLCAISKNGEKLWEKEIGQGLGTHPMCIKEDGTLYVCLLGTLYALDPDGGIRWKYKPKEAIVINTPAIDINGNLYFNITPYGLMCLDSNGNEVWCKDCKELASSPPVLAGNNKLLQLKFKQHYPQYKSWIDIYSTSGEKLDEYEMKGYIFSALIADDNLIYALSNIHTYKRKGWLDKIDVRWEMHVIGDPEYYRRI